MRCRGHGIEIFFDNESMYSIYRHRSGFTLLEVMIVIGVLALLATLIIVTLDPAERFRNAREARRLSDIRALSSAAHQYLVDKKGDFPEGIDERERQLGTGTSGCSIDNGFCSVAGDGDCIDLGPALRSYLPAIPEDPDTGTAEHTRYTIRREAAGNRIVVKACDSSERYVIQ